MAQLPIDLSGRKGLAPKFYGDINDTAGAPNARYLVAEGQMADGVYNPIRKFGYVAPANATFATVSGATSGNIIATEYDSINDIAYLAEAGNTIWTLSGLTDTSLAATITIDQSATETITDLEIYEMYGTRCLFYAYNLTGGNKDFSTIGVKALDLDAGVYKVDSRCTTDDFVQASDTELEHGNTTLSTKSLAQSYDLGSGDSVTFDRVRLKLCRRSTDTGTYTLQVSIQDDNGSNEPDGNIDASATLVASSVTKALSSGQPESEEFEDVYFDLNTTVTKSSGGKFWLVFSTTDIEEMDTTNDGIFWAGDTNNLSNGGHQKMFKSGSWTDTSMSNTIDFDFSLISTRDDVWLTGNVFNSEDDVTTVNGRFLMDGNTDVFMTRADNGYMYVFENHHVHRIDGTTTGGGRGSVKQDVLIFPSYFKTVDAVDTRGRMYVGVQGNPSSGDEDNRSYSEGLVGVYVWDRQSSVVGVRDFIPLYGVRDIKKLYIAPNGDVRAICIGDDRYVQIRGISSGAGKVIETLGISAYPETRDGVKVMNNMTVWLGADGIFYLHGALTAGEAEHIYKIGDMSGQATGAFTTGAIFTGHSSATTPYQAIYFGFTDTADQKVKKWYPHGTGTIDTVAQTGNIGNIYSPVVFLPSLTTVEHLNIFCLPGGTEGSATVAATLKIYANQSATPFQTESITYGDIFKGYKSIEINRPFINSIQLEIEHETTHTLGSLDFYPSFAVVEYVDTETLK